jgi:hypothetical protein
MVFFLFFIVKNGENIYIYYNLQFTFKICKICLNHILLSFEEKNNNSFKIVQSMDLQVCYSPYGNKQS